MNPARGQSGFSLLDALAALAIVGATLVPIMELQIGLSQQLQRLSDLKEELVARRNALAMLGTVNVGEERAGQRRLGSALVLRWTARPLSREDAALTYLGGEGRFRVTLYRVDAEVRDADGAAMTRFGVEQVGWRVRGAGR